MDDHTDITNYEGIAAEVIGDWASDVVGEPLVAPNFAIIVDGRMVKGGWVTVLLEPSGSPDWLVSALVDRGKFISEEGIGFMGITSETGQGEGDDE